MSAENKEVRTWLYHSEFSPELAKAEIEDIARSFATKNERLGLTGFLITNGKAVMQLLEGSSAKTKAVKKAIMDDDRHTNIVSEVWAIETSRAFPKWAMRTVHPDDYETLFKEIESAKIETIATRIARMVFDITFGD